MVSEGTQLTTGASPAILHGEKLFETAGKAYLFPPDTGSYKSCPLISVPSS